jgi:hypothetical protein
MSRSTRTTRTSPLPTRAGALAGALLLAGLLSLGGPVVPAQGQELEGPCIALNQDGERRDCTATERFSRCAANAVDSKDQCYEDQGGNWFLRRACDAYFIVDVGSCMKDTVFFVPK